MRRDRSPLMGNLLLPGRKEGDGLGGQQSQQSQPSEESQTSHSSQSTLNDDRIIDLFTTFMQTMIRNCEHPSTPAIVEDTDAFIYSLRYRYSHNRLFEDMRLREHTNPSPSLFTVAVPSPSPQSIYSPLSPSSPLYQSIVNVHIGKGNIDRINICAQRIHDNDRLYNIKL